MRSGDNDLLIKNNMRTQDILKLLKSGNFSIIYWDNEEPSLYKGKGFTADNFPEGIKEIELPNYSSGYLPPIVYLMAKALGGGADSI